MSERRWRGPEVSESPAVCVGGRPPGRGAGRRPTPLCRGALPKSPLRPPASAARSRRAFVRASQARTPSFLFQAAGRRCGRTPASRGLAPRCSRRAAFPHRDPRGAGPPQAVAGPLPRGCLEPFQDGTGFRLLDFEMTI